MDTKTITPSKPKDIKKKGKGKKIIAIIIILAVIIGVGYIVLQKAGVIKTLQMAYQLQKQQQLSADDKKIVDQLSKIMLLSNDYTPTMAIITDIDKLKAEQPGFFADAKNGDRLIIYPNQAIIFDAGANKIVKVGVVQFNSTQPQVQVVPFAILNSTSDEAKLTAMKEKLTKTFNNAVVVNEGKSAKWDYPETIVIDLTGKNTDLSKLGEAIGAKVSALPEGETAPAGASFLIIIGQN